MSTSRKDITFQPKVSFCRKHILHQKTILLENSPRDQLQSKLSPVEIHSLAVQREGKAGARGDPSPGASLPTQGGVSQLRNTAGKVLPTLTGDEPYLGSIQGAQAGAKAHGARDSTGHKLQSMSEGPIQKISHLPHRPEVYPGSRTISRTGDRLTNTRA